ncbi:unnamed protein product, partial [Staurois parvus]
SPQASGHLARQRAPRHLARLSGLRVNRHDSGHRVIRYRIVWLDSGHRVTRYDSGHWVTRHQVHLARQRAPRLWQGSGHRSHQVRQRALSQLARQRGTGSGTDHLDQQRGIESTGPFKDSQAGSVHHAG